LTDLVQFPILLNTFLLSAFTYFLIKRIFLAGLCIIGLSLWLWFDESFEKEIRQNIKVEYSNNADMDNIKKDIRTAIIVSFWVLCGCGLAAAIIGLIGTCGALCGNRCITAFYLVLIILLVLIEVGIGVFIVCYRSTVSFIFYLLILTYYILQTAVWDRFNFSVMIAGSVTIGIVALQILAVILAISIIVTVSPRT
uniref:Protein PNS1 n=1 Tax=Syphacia muris TaxID=451379 RepID=A0A0N5ANL1_9BILA